MAARRLVVVMVVLLGLSTLATALVQPPDRRSETTTDEPPAEPAKDGGWTGHAPLAGRVVDARMSISNAPPRDIRVRSGDQLQLMVSGPLGEEIVIPAFGLTETMSADAAARFDILIDRFGTFDVRGLDSGRLAGRIVSARGCVPAKPPAPAGGSKARACAPAGAPEGSGRDRSAPRP